MIARLRESWRAGHVASGCVAGALFGLLGGELGFWEIAGWDFSIQDVLIFAIVGALASAFVVALRALLLVDVALLGVAAVAGLTPIMSGLTSRWIREDALPHDGVDAIVVLSGAVTSAGTLKVAGTERLLSALAIARDAPAARLFTTRVNVRGSSVTSDADQRRLVTLAGVADRWSIIGSDSRSTRDELLAVVPRLREMGARRIAVVTSPMHTRRACAAFERAGLRVICLPALERDGQTRSLQGAGDRIAAFAAYLYERLGWWVYRTRGWVSARPDVDPSIRNL